MPIFIRPPKKSDVRQLLNFINSLVREEAQISVNAKQTLKQEEEWLLDNLKLINANKLHHLVAVHEGSIIGSVEIRRGRYRESHIGEYRIAIKKGYRNLGIGRRLSEIILEIAKKDKNIKLIYLFVFSTNKKAISLYKKLGFKKTASLPKRIFYKGRYLDMIVMDYTKI